MLPDRVLLPAGRNRATEIPPLGAALEARQAEAELEGMLLKGDGVLVRNLERERPRGRVDVQPEAVEVAGVAWTKDAGAGEERGGQEVARDPARLGVDGTGRHGPAASGGDGEPGGAVLQGRVSSESMAPSTIRTTRRDRSITRPS